MRKGLPHICIQKLLKLKPIVHLNPYTIGKNKYRCASESMENERLDQISKLDLDLEHTMYYVKSPAPDSLKRQNKSIQIGN
jgi:hypothetical protein